MNPYLFISILVIALVIIGLSIEVLTAQYKIVNLKKESTNKDRTITNLQNRLKVYDNVENNEIEELTKCKKFTNEVIEQQKNLIDEQQGTIERYVRLVTEDQSLITTQKRVIETQKKTIEVLNMKLIT